MYLYKMSILPFPLQYTTILYLYIRLETSDYRILYISQNFKLSDLLLFIFYL